jgi:hypothetical protein
LGCHERVGDVGPGANDLAAWLTTNPDLRVTDPTDGRIGLLPATVMDVTVSDRAANTDPECPVAVCVDVFGFPQWDGVWGVATDAVVRVYLADVAYGGRTHLFVALIDPAAIDPEFLADAERLLSTVRVPVGPG